MSSIDLLLKKGRLSLLIFGILLTLLAPAANALTKHLSMIGVDGQPLKTTLITITSPDGSTTQRVTDEKGILEHDFKKAGVYTLSDPSGNTLKTVSVAGSGMSKPLMIGLAAGAAVALIAIGSSSSDSTSDPGAGDPGTGDPDPEEPGDGGEDEGGSIGGTYNVTATVANNPADLPVLIDTLVLRYEIIGTALTIFQVSSNANFPAQLSGTIAGESFTASSSGSYDGTTTLFQLAGSLAVSQNLNFLINIGSDGTLKDGATITYNATGTK